MSFKKLFSLYMPEGTKPSDTTNKVSLSVFQGGSQLGFSCEPAQNYFTPKSEEALRLKFRSHQVPELLPSRVIRRLGGM